MLQQLLQNPIFCRFLLKKKNFDKKNSKKNQKIKIGQFSISAWLEARFSSYDQKTANLGKQVYTLTTGGFCTVQLCLLFIDGATGCFYLPSTFDLSSLTLNEQLRRWADGRLFILFSGAGSGLVSRFTGAELGLWEFSHQDTMEENSHRPSSAPVNLDPNPDPAPEKGINSLPSAHLLSCSLSVKEERSKVEGR